MEKTAGGTDRGAPGADGAPADPTTVLAAIRPAVAQVVVGKAEMVDHVLAAVLCDGHVLLEDVPGVGKTLLARSLAAAIGCEFRRVQFTPDVLPSDITGSSVFDQRAADFTFRPGPIFTHLLLADEINRATCAPSRPSSRPWRSTRSPPTAAPHLAVAPSVPRPGDPEPDRTRGHLSPA